MSDAMWGATFKEDRTPQPKSNPSKAKTKITVSIPVKVGGYTGQRDNWEEIERDFVVTFNDDDTVSLQDSSGVRRKITFDPEALQEALGILGKSKRHREAEKLADEIRRSLEEAAKPQRTAKPLDGGLNYREGFHGGPRLEKLD